MAGVMIAEVKHVRMMLVAVAPPTSLVTPVKRRGGRRVERRSAAPTTLCEPKTDSDRTPKAPPVATRKYKACHTNAPPVASRKCHACRSLRALSGSRPHPQRTPCG
eukprot:123608-Pyramimonas_sp.AAC.1